MVRCGVGDLQVQSDVIDPRIRNAGCDLIGGLVQRWDVMGEKSGKVSLGHSLKARLKNLDILSQTIRMFELLEPQNGLIVLALRKDGLASRYSPNGKLQVQLTLNSLESHLLVSLALTTRDYLGSECLCSSVLVCPPKLDTACSQLGITAICWPVFMQGALLVAKETKQKQKQERVL